MNYSQDNYVTVFTWSFDTLAKKGQNMKISFLCLLKINLHSYVCSTYGMPIPVILNISLLDLRPLVGKGPIGSLP